MQTTNAPPDLILKKPSNAKSAYSIWMKENKNLLAKATPFKDYYRNDVSPDSKKRYENMSGADKRKRAEERTKYNKRKELSLFEPIKTFFTYLMLIST
jgi:hypothetical protein